MSKSSVLNRPDGRVSEQQEESMVCKWLREQRTNCKAHRECLTSRMSREGSAGIAFLKNWPALQEGKKVGGGEAAASPEWMPHGRTNTFGY